MTTLLTGGAGFIGSHMAGLLIQKKTDFVIVDNLSNSDLKNISLLESHFNCNINFQNIDIRNKKNMRNIFDRFNIKSVIHFASLKSVSDSILNPNIYEDNNVYGASLLIELIKEFNINKFIFSSSACVYGEPKYLPINENHPLNPINPYGKNKMDIEFMIQEDKYFKKQCCSKILRYFNPVGSFDGGVIGESLFNTPKNLMPYILGVINGIYPLLNVFGNDYMTDDGTAIRDYIHVMDLVDAHFLALMDNERGVKVFNIGMGVGYSVLDIINTFERVNNVVIPYKFKQRREGDVESCFADNSRIKNDLCWLPLRTLENMCMDAFIFSQKQKKLSYSQIK